MRLDPKLVHPSIFEATDGVLWSGRYTATGSGPDAKAAAEHQKVWFQTYWQGCLAYAVLSGAALIATGVLAHDMAKPGKALFILGMMAAIAGVGVFGYVRNLRQITAPELGALLPLLELSDVQRAYSETLVALERSGRTEGEIEETMRALNALLDEDQRLVAAREAISGSEKGHDRESLVAEREKIAARIANARDPDAKAAFEGSLALLDERIQSYDALGSALERIEAHQELLRQAVLATRDAALHRAGSPALPDLGTDSLRSAVARAREGTQETERALAELRAI